MSATPGTTPTGIAASTSIAMSTVSISIAIAIWTSIATSTWLGTLMLTLTETLTLTTATTITVTAKAITIRAETARRGMESKLLVEGYHRHSSNFWTGNLGVGRELKARTHTRKGNVSQKECESNLISCPFLTGFPRSQASLTFHSSTSHCGWRPKGGVKKGA